VRTVGEEKAATEIWLTPEVRSALVEGLETRQRLKESDATLIGATTAVAAAAQLKKPELLYAVREFETPETRRRRIIPPLHMPTLQVESPFTVKPPYEIPKSPEYEPKYNLPSLTTTTPPPMAEVPPPPTYTPVPTVSIYDVPTYGVPPTSTYTYEVPPMLTYTPVPPTTVPQISEVPLLEVPTVPTPDTVPEPQPLPPGWWRLLPPGMFAEDAKEGAYRVQEGKRQILALA
jgi:hypothetical protein